MLNYGTYLFFLFTQMELFFFPLKRKYASLEQITSLFFITTSSAPNMNKFLFLDEMMEMKQCICDKQNNIKNKVFRKSQVCNNNIVSALF